MNVLTKNKITFFRVFLNRQIIIILIIAFIIPINSSAITDIKFEKICDTEYQNAIGYTYSLSLGQGVSYRRWLNTINAFQFTIGPISVINEAGDNIPAGNVSGSILIKPVYYSPIAAILYGSIEGAFVNINSKISADYWFALGGGFEYKIWYFSSLVALGFAFGPGMAQICIDYGIYYRF